MKPIHDGASIRLPAAKTRSESESDSREAFADAIGATPGRARVRVPGARGTQTAPRELVACMIESPLGPMLAAASAQGVCLLEFADRRALATQIATLRKRSVAVIRAGSNAHIETLQHELAAYFAGRSAEFSVQLEAPGTEFQAAVWEALRAIPSGQTRSYLDIARQIGRPTATRAVARANGDNRLAILIPCHRVIGSDGALTGYGGGVWRKQWLLEHERGISGWSQEGLFRPAGQIKP